MEKFSRTKSVFFRFYILCENFSKIGPIIKKISNFVNNPLKWTRITEKSFVRISKIKNISTLHCNATDF